MRPTTPPTAAELKAALQRHDLTCTPALAAVFLASPRECVPGLHTGFDPAPGAGVAWMRGFRVAVRAETRHMAVAVAHLARMAHKAGDTYLDLQAEPETWVKVFRSGTAQVCYGQQMLWGLPRLGADLEVGLESIHEVIAAARAAEDPADVAPMVVGEGVALSYRSGQFKLTNLTAPGRLRGAGTAAATPTSVAVHDVAQMVGGNLVGVLSTADVVEVAIELRGGPTVETCIRIHAGGYQLLPDAYASTTGSHAARTTVTWPHDWVPLADGTARHRSGVVARVSS